MLPQTPNLRHLLSSANLNLRTSSLFLSPFYSFSSSFSSLSLRFGPDSSRNPCPSLLLTTASSNSFSMNLRKSSSSLRNIRKGESQLSMEENENVGFNRERALGMDKSDQPKKALRLKMRKLNPVNTISYVQILGTGLDTQDTSPSVLLFFDKQRFIFNAGEGLQRFCTEHKIKLSKIDHIFLSRVCSETAGGLPGLLLTLAGIGEEGMSLKVWGPSDLKYLVDAMKSFIPNAAMVHTCSFGPPHGSDGIPVHDAKKFCDPFILVDDEVVKVSAILLRPSYSVPVHIKESSSGLNPLDPRLQIQNSEIQLKPGDVSVIYVCELPEIKGKFDPKMAEALGLKPGPKYRELQNGNPVKSDSKNIMVHPCDVMGPSVLGPIVILVDCPTLNHLEELLALQSLNNYYVDASNIPVEGPKCVSCIIHLSPASVTNTSDYQKWMSRFGEAHHIMAGHELRNIEIPILKSSARIAARLNYLCPQFFPAPGIWSLNHSKCSESGAGASNKCAVSKFVSAKNLLKFILRPYGQLGLDKSIVPNLMSSSEVIDELLLELPEIVDAAQQIDHLWHEAKETKGLTSSEDDNDVNEEPWLSDRSLPSCLEHISREDMEIVLLGTGSSQPSKYRNVSSIFINLFSKGSILLDCGEGTLGQLKRRFGIQGADDAIRGLKCIWISHIHADHHTGLARVLALRRDLLKEVPHEPLIVIGPRQLKRFLDAYQRLEDLDMQFLDCKHTTEASQNAFESNQNHTNVGSHNGVTTGSMNHSIDSTLFAKGTQMHSFWKRPDSPVDNGAVAPIIYSLKDVLRDAGLEALISFPVVHCPQAFGVALRASDRLNCAGKKIPGWKIVYSGDTRPCPELVKASHGATVLIHEATFEDGMLEEAIARNHSTTKEAVEVGDSAGVYRIILTHFSQRYPKIPVFDESHMHKTCIAFDMMSVNLADLHLLPRFLPYIKLLFKNEMIVDESDDVVNAVSAAG